MNTPAAPPAAHEAHTEHIVSAKSYIAVFVTLLVLTATTTAVAFADLGPWNTVVALAIAFIKATLAIMIGLTFSDFATRGWLPVYRMNP